MSDLRKIISTRLRQLRHAREWTVEETTRRLSALSSETINPSRYGNWEQGIRAPRLEQFVELGALFGVAPAYIAGISGDDGSSPEASRYTVPTPAAITTPAGPMALEQIDDSFAISLELIDSLGLNRNRLAMVRAEDDNMAGVIEKGDRVLIDMGSTSVTRDDIFALLINSRVRFRWIRHALTGGYTVQDESGKEKADMTAEGLSKLTIIGRAAAIIHTR